MTIQSSLPEDQFADALSIVLALKKKAVRENKRKNLDLLWQVLETMWHEGCREFGIADVGRRLADVGGPKTQSLRNEGGQDFHRLIKAFATCSGAYKGAPLVQGRSQLELAVEGLSDPAVRAIFRQVVAENKLYKTQNDQLRSAFKELSVRRPSDATQSTHLNSHQVHQLTSGEKNLLRKNLSPERFEENGWNIMEHGEVVDDTGCIVLSSGFMDIMAKVFD